MVGDKELRNFFSQNIIVRMLIKERLIKNFYNIDSLTSLLTVNREIDLL